jgi:hypothetical protein
MRKPVKYTRHRVRHFWWNIKKGTQTVGFISIGSGSGYYAIHIEPYISIGTGYRTVNEAFIAYVRQYPIESIQAH